MLSVSGGLILFISSKVIVLFVMGKHLLQNCYKIEINLSIYIPALFKVDALSPSRVDIISLGESCGKILP